MNDHEIEITVKEFKIVQSLYSTFGFRFNSETGKFTVGWSEIMPVIDKIESLGCFEIIIRSSHIKANCFDPFNTELIYTQAITENVTKIQAVYKTVVEFIKWYKQNER